MQINNYTANNKNINFTALKSIKFRDGYRNKPDLQLELLDAIEKNNTIKDIYKKYDTNIIFHTYKYSNKYYSEMEMWCDKPRYDFFSKIRRFLHPGYFLGLNTFDTPTFTLKEATDGLADKIESKRKKFSNAKLFLDKTFIKKNLNPNSENNIKILVKKKIESMIYK